MAEQFTCIVTGAGTGIGRATALKLAHKGSALALIGRRPEPLEKTAELVVEAGGQALVIPADIGTDGSSELIVTRTVEKFGRLDGLVNDAGVAMLGEIGAVSPEDLLTMFNVNVIGPILLVRAAQEHLAAAKGSVVNVSSGAGVNAIPKAVGYGASKAALLHATRTLARELGPAVRVNAVIPGTCRTEIWQGTGLSQEQIDDRLIELGKTVPSGRVGEPEEVATWICRLLEHESDWVTGTTIAVDGGFSA